MTDERNGPDGAYRAKRAKERITGQTTDGTEDLLEEQISEEQLEDLIRNQMGRDRIVHNRTVKGGSEAESERQIGQIEEIEQIEQIEQKKEPETLVDFDVPLPPKLTTKPIPTLASTKKHVAEPGSYRNTALASQAATSFISPIIILGVVGWLIDGKFHTGGVAIIVGFILGFIIGVSSLLRIVNKMDSK